MVLRIGPAARLVSYFTLSIPLSPGAIGSFGGVGTVHPQVEYALVIIRGASPVLVNLNSLTPSPPCSTSP